MRILNVSGIGAVALAGVLASTPVQAQPLGSFTWQLQPFCNKVIVTVTQNGSIYTLDGYDDQCAAAQRAPLVGIATPNPDGSIGFGLNIVTVPSGKNVHVEARIDLASLGGSWSDSAGNSGAFAFNGNVAGSARPAPTVSGAVLTAGSIPGTAIATGAVGSAQIANGAVGNAQIANGAVSSLQTSNEPGVAGNYTNDPVALTGAVQDVIGASMRVPRDGFVKIEVTGSWSPTSAGTDAATCQLQKGGVAAINLSQPRFALNDRGGATAGFLGFSAHRIVPVAAADNPLLITSGQSFRLVCDLALGAITIDNVLVSATYYATDYAPIIFIFPFDTTPPQQ